MEIGLGFGEGPLLRPQFGEGQFPGSHGYGAWFRSPVNAAVHLICRLAGSGAAGGRRRRGHPSSPGQGQ